MNPLDAWTFDSGLYLVNVAVAATLACASALAAARVLKSRPAPMRYGLLLAAMLLALLSPGVAWTARALGLSPFRVSPTALEELPAPAAPVVEPIAPLPVPEAPMMPAPLEPAFPPPAEPAIEAAPPTEPLPWPQILLAAAALVWSAGTAVCLVFLVRGLVLVQRLRKSLRPARGARLDAAAIRAACALGLLKLPRVCVSHLVPAPLSLGLARPVIVMPEGLAETLSDTDLEAVVLHEAAHIAHRDHWVGLLQRVVLALFWWNPLVRMLSDRLSAAREEVCDNYVVRAQGDGHPFAQFLVRMAGRLTACRRLTTAIGLVQEPRRGLEERIRGLLRKERNTMTRMNLAAMALVGVFSLGLGGLMLIATVRAAGEAGDTVAAPEEAGQAVGGLRLSLTVPCEKEYGGRMTLPLLLVLKNDRDVRTTPVELRWGPPAIEAVDADGRPVRVRDLIDITPWEGRLTAGAVPPGAAVPWMLWFDRFSFIDPLKPGTTLRVRVRLGGAGGLASNWVALGIKSSGPPLLGPGNVPGTWQGFMDLVYREANNLRGYRAIHVAGDGRVTVVTVTGGKDPLLGRHEVALAKADLDALADLLNRQWVWALYKVKQETAYPDEPTVALSLSSAGNLVAGEWPMRTVHQTPALLAIQQAMVRLMEKAVAAAQAAQHGWGPLSDDGVQARLRADSASWKAGETPTFRASVRNQGMRELFVAQAQQLCELEVDAQWYRWMGDIAVKSSAFGPGREHGDVPVVLDDKWHSKEGVKPLRLEPGRHTIRIAFIASPQDRSAGPPARAVSNPVEIEILPAPEPTPAEQIVHTLTRAYPDPDKEKAAMARLSADGQLRKGVVSLLVETLEGATKPWEGSNTIWALRQLNATDTLPLLRERWQKTPKHVYYLLWADPRAQLLETIAAFERPDEATRFLTGAMNDEDEATPVRFRAMVLLCKRGDEAAVSEVTKVLNQRATRLGRTIGPPESPRANVTEPQKWDRDGDGISDYAEHGMLLDPNKADTDGDGIHDGNDRNPVQIPAAKIHEDESIAGRIFQIYATYLVHTPRTTNWQGAGLPHVPLIIVRKTDSYDSKGNPSLLANMELVGFPGQVLTLSDQQIEQYRNLRGPNTQVPIVNIHRLEDKDAEGCRVYALSESAGPGLHKVWRIHMKKVRGLWLPVEWDLWMIT